MQPISLSDAINQMLYISVAELKSSQYWDPSFNDNPETYSDNFIIKAINLASIKIDDWTGNYIGYVDNLVNLTTDQQSAIKLSTAIYTMHWLNKGAEYILSATTFSQGSQSYSITPPSDLQFVPDECQKLLIKAGLYKNMNYKNLNLINDLNKNNWRWCFDDGAGYVVYDYLIANYIRYNNFLSSSGTIDIGVKPKNNTIENIIDLNVNMDKVIEEIETEFDWSKYVEILKRLKLGSNNQLTYVTNTQFTDQNDLINKDYVDNTKEIIDAEINAETTRAIDVEKSLQTNIDKKQDKITFTTDITMQNLTASSLALPSQPILKGFDPTTLPIDTNGIMKGTAPAPPIDSLVDGKTTYNNNNKISVYVEYENNPLWTRIDNASPLVSSKYYRVMATVITSSLQIYYFPQILITFSALNLDMEFTSLKYGTNNAILVFRGNTHHLYINDGTTDKKFNGFIYEYQGTGTPI